MEVMFYTEVFGNFGSDEAKEIARLKKELKNSEDALLIFKKQWLFWLEKNGSNL